MLNRYANSGYSAITARIRELAGVALPEPSIIDIAAGNKIRPTVISGVSPTGSICQIRSSGFFSVRVRYARSFGRAV
jgi:hypothetical protein